MGGELLVAKSWSSDPVYISYSVNYVYPNEIKGHFMVSLIIPPVYHFNHYFGFEWLIEVFILLPFYNSKKRLQIVCISLCLPMPETMAKIFMWQAVHVTFMKGDMMINSSGLLKMMSLSVPKIKTIALYYIPQVPKIPSWQDPLTPNPNHSTSSPWHKFLSAGSLTISTTALHFTHTRRATKCA